jgi:hypothetical protein
MIALASATGRARTLPAIRTGAGEMMPCSMHFLMLSVLRGFAVRLRPRHAATSPGREECPEQADVRVVALMAKTARTLLAVALGVRSPSSVEQVVGARIADPDWHRRLTAALADFPAADWVPAQLALPDPETGP